MKNYYCLLGATEVGVFNSWKKAESELIYCTGHRYTKKFPDYLLANKAALAHLESIAPHRLFPTELPVNYLVKVTSLKQLIVPYTICP